MNSSENAGTKYAAAFVGDSEQANALTCAAVDDAQLIAPPCTAEPVTAIKPFKRVHGFAFPNW